MERFSAKTIALVFCSELPKWQEDDSSTGVVCVQNGVAISRNRRANEPCTLLSAEAGVVSFPTVERKSLVKNARFFTVAIATAMSYRTWLTFLFAKCRERA